jgi:hypothetical protein
MKFELPKKLNIKAFAIFAIVAVAAFLLLAYFRDSLPKITEVILIIELCLLIAITWGLAAHAVLKSLFAVSVELSLILFLADEYCKTPPLAHRADNALMTLVGVGMIYIGIKFFWTVYQEAVARSKSLKEAYDNKRPWIVLIPFALFTGIFAWQVIQVLMPIVQNLCVYHP